MVFGSAHLPSVSDACLIGAGTDEIGRSPQVLAGELPRGAVFAEARRADVYAWEGAADAATAVGLAGHGHRVWIARTATDPRQIPMTTLAGSIEGAPVTLDLIAPQEPWIRNEGWVAVARTDRFAVTVTGYDEPPNHLDLQPIT